MACPFSNEKIIQFFTQLFTLRMNLMKSIREQSIAIDLKLLDWKMEYFRIIIIFIFQL